ncbi:MAG: dehypoxanthine futalosine cyclase, partial [Desulfonatronospira sp. MSAO_Bac3]
MYSLNPESLFPHENRLDRGKSMQRINLDQAQKLWQEQNLFDLGRMA